MDTAKKVLLVEDEDYIRELYKRQLDLSGFVTDAFGLGKDGLAAVSQNQYDLVLLDIMLPDVNGLQILQQLKQNDKSKNTPVVLLTNLGQDAVIKQGFELGADGYLVKAAYTPDQIVQEVKNIMARKQSAPATTAMPAPATAIEPLSQIAPAAPQPGGFGMDPLSQSTPAVPQPPVTVSNPVPQTTTVPPQPVTAMANPLPPVDPANQGNNGNSGTGI